MLITRVAWGSLWLLLVAGLMACQSVEEPAPLVVVIPSITPAPTLTPSPTPTPEGPPVQISPVEALPDVLPADGNSEFEFTVTTRHADTAGLSVRLNAAGGGEVIPQTLTLPAQGETVSFTYIAGQVTTDIRLDVLDDERRIAEFPLRIEVEPLILEGQPLFPPGTDASRVPLQYTLRRADGQPLQGTYMMRVSVVGMGNEGLLLAPNTDSAAPQQQIRLQAAPGNDTAQAQLTFQPAAGNTDPPAIVTAQLPGRTDVSAVRLEIYWTNIEARTRFLIEPVPASRYAPEASRVLRWNLRGRQILCWRHVTADNRLIQPPIAALQYQELLAPSPLRLAVGGGEWPPDTWLNSNERRSTGQFFYEQDDPTCAWFTPAADAGGVLRVQAAGIRRTADAVASVPVLAYFGQLNLSSGARRVQITTVEGATIPLQLPQVFHTMYQLQRDATLATSVILLPLWIDADDMREGRLDSGDDATATLYLIPDTVVNPLVVTHDAAFQSDDLWLPADEAGQPFTESLTVNGDTRTLIRAFLMVRPVTQ